MPETKYYLSQITLPDGKTYDLKDAEARALIAQIEAGILAFIKCTNAANTPEGVQWTDGSTVITGTLVASETTQGKIYLVPQQTASGKDIFAEYTTVATSGSGTEQDPYVFIWEKLGDTEIDFSNLGALAYKDSASGTVSFTTVDSAAFTNGAVSASATYTPAGTVSTPTITVTPATDSIPVKLTDGSVTAGSAASFTSGTFSGGSFTQGTDQFTAPVLTTSVSGETLTISFSQGSFTQGTDSFTAATHSADTFQANTPTAVTLPTYDSATVVTGITSASSTQPTFSGTEATISSTGTASGDVELTKTAKTETVTVS